MKCKHVDEALLIALTGKGSEGPRVPRNAGPVRGVVPGRAWNFLTGVRHGRGEWVKRPPQRIRRSAHPGRRRPWPGHRPLRRGRPARGHLGLHVADGQTSEAMMEFIPGRHFASSARAPGNTQDLVLPYHPAPASAGSHHGWRSRRGPPRTGILAARKAHAEVFPKADQRWGCWGRIEPSPLRRHAARHQQQAHPDR